MKKELFLRYDAHFFVARCMRLDIFFVIALVFLVPLVMLFLCNDNIFLFIHVAILQEGS